MIPTISIRALASPALGASIAAASLVASLAATSCAPDKMPFAEDETHVFAVDPEGEAVTVTGHELNLGYQSYMRYCYACHGEKGDGKGPASYGYRPPPRNFTQGIFKFARIRSSDDVPHDDDIVRIVKGGLHGTPMLQWDIPEVELRRVIQYIKTFAPKKWEKKKKNGEPVKNIGIWRHDPDPWTTDAEAVERGKELYHLKAECVNCHPAYGSKKELYELSLAANKREPDTFKPLTGFRDDFYGSVAKDSAEYGVKLLPPDFTFNVVRSVHEGSELEDLYRVISYGVYPIMPAWQGALTDKDIWALSHYIKSLMDLRGTPEAGTLQAKFAAQAPFEVPKAEEPKPAEAAPAEPEKKEGDAAAGKDKKEGDAKKTDAKKVDTKKVDKKPAAKAH